MSNAESSADFRLRRLVEFHDTDAAGIAHFSTFFTYMEAIEHAYLRHLGLSVLMNTEEGPLSWPRVEANCEFLSAVRFEDEIDIELRVARVGQKSVTYRFMFWRGDTLAAKGGLTAVCCRLSPVGPPQSIVIPDFIRARLPQGR